MQQRSPAGLAPRALAFFIDGLLLLALSAPLMWLAYREGIARLGDMRPVSLLINWLLPGLISIAFWHWQGATPGKLLAGVRVIDARSGGRPSLAQSGLRWLGYFISAAPLGLGLLWALIDPNRQTWHDKLAGTLVVPRRQRTAEGEERPGYVSAHWRGEQSLAQSFWVNNVLLSLPLALALTGLMSWISLKGEGLQANSIAILIGWPLMIVIDVWCIVGAWRAAAEYRRIDGSALWANLARLCLGIGALQTLASALIGFVPQMGEFWQMARGIDPIGQVSLKLSEDGRILRLSGPIGMGDAGRLQQLLDSAPPQQKVKLFELASPGGRVYEAERMVELVRKAGSQTRAVGDCESACTLVFLAGSQRQLMPGAQLGFHRASSGTYNPVFDEIANRELAATYRRMGLPEYFIDKTSKTPAHSMWYPKSEELVSHELILAPPKTLDVALPGSAEAPAAEYADALRSNPAWHQIEQRYAGTIATAAARMQAARADQADEDAIQTEALRVLALRLPELIVASPPELRRRYLALLRAQLQAAQASGPEDCPALLAGDLGRHRRLPVELLARETSWLGAAAEATPPRRLPGPPSGIELEVVRRTLGAQAPGMLAGLWSDGTVKKAAPRCDAVLRVLDQAAVLPAAQRELAERVVFQSVTGA